MAYNPPRPRPASTNRGITKALPPTEVW